MFAETALPSEKGDELFDAFNAHHGVRAYHKDETLAAFLDRSYPAPARPLVPKICQYWRVDSGRSHPHTRGRAPSASSRCTWSSSIGGKSA